LPTISSKQAGQKPIQTFDIGAGQTKQNDINSNVPIIAPIGISRWILHFQAAWPKWSRTMSSDIMSEEIPPNAA
jgi:hypothetical protein